MSERLDLTQYEITRTLGTGSFGRVRLAQKRGTNDFYAMKILKKHQVLKLSQTDHVFSEFKILKTLSHPFVVSLEGFTQDKRCLYFCLELVQGGELFTYLRKVGKFPTSQVKAYAAQIVCMFEYMHSLDIIYRDLKPENLLIAPDGYLKLTDFGLAKAIRGRTYTICGTPEYLAPEVLLSKGHGKPVDWWTLGIIIYEMSCGFDPFSDEDPMMIYQKILRGKVRFPRPFDSASRGLIKHLLVGDLSKRYGNLKGGVNDIKHHRFFSGTHWERLLQKSIPMAYLPKINDIRDFSHFTEYPDSLTLSVPIKKSEDPFRTWDS
jgi:protein kinase A